jgi:addiction module HigA family antidote
MRVSEIIAGKRAITVDTGLRLSRYFGLNDSFWTGLQLDHDAARAKDEFAEVLANIKPMEVA